MIKILKKVLVGIGVDKSIFFTSSSYIIGAFGSLVSVLFIMKYLSGTEQGFYYTFGSVAAIQIFFELGLNGIITQYVAHEASHLKWHNEFDFTGESKYISRLSSLLHFSIKWYSFFACLLIVSLIIVGLFFFRNFDTTGGTVNWTFPWLVLSIVTGLNLLFSPLIAFLQGLGKVKETSRIQFFTQFIRLAFVIGSLALGVKLYVLGISGFVGIIILVVFIGRKYRKLIIFVWRVKIVEKVNYRKEIFPYQWKIALSWISGYFIFQLFNPVLFATEGAIVAGQMGLTLAALNGVLSLSLAWITTKVPLFSGLIAQKEYAQLDFIFNKTIKQSSLINLCAMIVLAITIYLVRLCNLKIGNTYLGNRFLDYVPMFLMMVSFFLSQLGASWATYLRCHKNEPFLIISIVSGILCSLSTIFLGKYFGVIGITAGYCSIALLTLPWSYNIFKTKKVQWHVNK